MAMAAAPLPAARQITRPFGAGGRCRPSTTSGWAAATAASKIARRRGRRSVIALFGPVRGGAVIPFIRAKENPRERGPRGSCACLSGDKIRRLSADVAAHDVAKTLPGFALELD